MYAGYAQAPTREVWYAKHILLLDLFKKFYCHITLF